MYFTLFELSIDIRAGALTMVWLPKCNPRPLILIVAMKKVLLNYGLSVCDNDYMSMIEGCPNIELLRVIKNKETC